MREYHGYNCATLFCHCFVSAVVKHMHKSHNIEPFPKYIDRAYFGAYLTGLADGEGCFTLNIQHQARSSHYQAHFKLALRADDADILKLVQSFWGCGILGFNQQPDKKRNSKPRFYYNVHKTTNLVDVVIPHFEKYPLLAKKRRHFDIWREAVLFMSKVQARPLVRTRYGSLPKWTQQEMQTLHELSDLLQKQKIYLSPDQLGPLPEAATVANSFATRSIIPAQSDGRG